MRVRGADLLVRSLAIGGTRQVFALSGNHVMPVFDAAIGAPLRIIHVRHEAAAVHMADAWARMTGETGFALLTAGPGFANGLSALYTAQQSESPVVLLSGHAPTAEVGRGAFQEMKQAELAAPLTKASWVTRSPDEVGSDLAKASRIARSGRPGPVHLSLPADVLSGAVEQPQQCLPDPHSFVPPAGGPPAEELARVLDLLAKARRPVVVCGPAFTTTRGRQRLAALARTIKVPVIALESPRGVNDPSLGALASILQKADLAVLLGKRADFMLRFGKAFADGCQTLSIEDDSDLLGIPDALAKAAIGDWTETGWLQEAEREIRKRPQPAGRNGADSAAVLHPAEVCEEVQRILDLDQRSVLVCDGGEFSQWAQACLSAGERLINGPAGAIGPSIPFALAARLQRGDAGIVVAMLGDGTFGFHMAEFDTAVRYGLPFIAVIGNDGCWNAEYQIQVREYGRERAVGCELLPARYDRVAEALGGHGGYAVDRAQLRAALRAALESGKPACVNVRTVGAAAPAVK